MKHTIAEIEEIKKQLIVFLDKNATKDWYIFNKNLQLCKRILKKHAADMDDLRKKFCILNASGNPKLFALDKNDVSKEFDEQKMSEYKKDALGNTVLRVKYLDDDAKKLFTENSEALAKEEHEVSWHTVSIDRFKDDDGNMSPQAGDYSDLVDVIFVETEPKPDSGKDKKSAKAK